MPEAPAPRRRRLSPEQRREEILAAATALIAEVGFNGVSLDAFAEAAAITKQGLLYHFPSRDELLAAVLARRDELDLGAVGVGDSHRASGPAEARAMLGRLLAHNFSRPEIIRLYTMLGAEAFAPDHPARDYFQMRLRRSRHRLTTWVLWWHPDPDGAALEFLAFSDGLQWNWLRDPGIEPMARWEGFADRFFAGFPEPGRRGG